MAAFNTSARRRDSALSRRLPPRPRYVDSVRPQQCRRARCSCHGLGRTEAACGGAPPSGRTGNRLAVMVVILAVGRRESTLQARCLATVAVAGNADARC